MRLGEWCHMIGSPSGELLKKPQQSGQGQALMPKEKREVCKCVHVEECTNREELGGNQSLQAQQSWVLDNLKTSYDSISRINLPA